MSEPITDEMVERAAYVLWRSDVSEVEVLWEPNRAQYLALAREALEAALSVAPLDEEDRSS